MLRPAAFALCAAILAASSFTRLQPANASAIPTISDGEHVLVAVEPLLDTMTIRYTLTDGRLSVGDRAYVGSLVTDAGLHYTEPRAIAAFLNLQLTYPNGVLTFGPHDPHPGAVAAAPDADALHAIRARLLALLNAHRAQTGLPALAIDPLAEVAAQSQASDMESAGVMRHTDSLGRSPYERFASCGGRASTYGENVAYFGLDVTDLVNEWQAIDKLDSIMMAEQAPDDGHREAILNPVYRNVGIGVAIGSNGLYLAEDFYAR
ncbi:MAG TPA: CAP domain-containing protein [Candidatus Eremiobacteraceae bacterium]|nr:CAP domain-containing protein [Candidatus Eremiobacteraceae bacterium]